MKEIKVGMKCKQVKAIAEFDFNYIDAEFEITKVTDYIIKIKGYMGEGGISREEFNTYFELVEEQINENFVSEEGYRVIRNGMVTIIILQDGSKGISKCLPEDTYDKNKGLEIAFIKAQIKSLNKKLKTLSK